MQQRIQFNEGKFQKALDTANRLIELQRTVIELPTSIKYAERTELANLIHLKGQAMERCMIPMEENLACQ